MARVYKIEIYVTDVNEDFYDANDYINYIHNTIDYCSVKSFNMQTSDTFEWYDEISINRYGCSQEDFEKFFLKGIDKQ